MVSTSQFPLSLPDLPGIGEGWELLLPAAERARRCTGSSAVATEEKRNAIISACVELGTRRVAEAFGVSREVVRALRSEAVRTGKLDHLKEEMGRRALGAADRVLDRLEDEIDQLPRASLAITYGILKDKGLLLTGQPTSRVEHIVTATHADINEWMDSLPVVSGGAALQKGGSVQVVGELVESAEIGAGSGSTSAPNVVAGDTQSPALCQLPEGAGRDGAEGGHNRGEKGGRP